jgi:hypothetical protein
MCMRSGDQEVRWAVGRQEEGLGGPGAHPLPGFWGPQRASKRLAALVWLLGRWSRRHGQEGRVPANEPGAAATPASRLAAPAGRLPGCQPGSRHCCCHLRPMEVRPLYRMGELGGRGVAAGAGGTGGSRLCGAASDALPRARLVLPARSPA